MRKVIILTVLWMGLSVWSAGAQETSRRALAEELLNLMKMRENIEKSFDMVKQMIPMQMDRMMKAPGQTTMPADASKRTEKMMDMVAQELSWDKIKDDYIALYAETFTDEELRGMIAFFKSPVGQAFISKQPEMMKKSMELSQKMIMKVMPKIHAMAREGTESVPSATRPQQENK